jgi:nucleoside-diphosphate-sugar epimerase
MSETQRILVTGATGKAGQAYIQRLLSEPGYEAFTIRALCHNRQLAPAERIEVVSGSIEYRDVVERAMRDVTHVIHLATCKETPDQIMDVAVKGMFWLLEACQASSSFKQFLLVGGDAGIGHFHYPRPVPITEALPHSAYPGCYALSKVLEEVMLEQYYIQYDLNGCCLRAPWIMEKDDFKYQLSFGEDVFGGPRWRDLVGAEQADAYIRANAIPVMLDAAGAPMRRNFVHLSDLISALLLALDNPKARQQTFNICMDEPVDYRRMGDYLAQTRGYTTAEIATPYHSTWLDNTKAKFLLGWHPRYNLERLIDEAFDYQRAAGDPRVIWYPG